MAISYLWGFYRGYCSGVQSAYYNSFGRGLRRLRGKMLFIETMGQLNGKKETAKVQIERDAIFASIAALYEFTEDNNIPNWHLSRLLMDLINIHNGIQPSDVLKVPSLSGRPRDPAQLDDLKGRMAALLEYRKAKGNTRQEAYQWIKNKSKKDIWTILGDPQIERLEQWRARWQIKSPDLRDLPGHIGYRSTLQMLTDDLDEVRLNAIFDFFSRLAPTKRL